MKKGFTLVELLCVIIIIAVVTGIVFPIVLGNVNKSKEELLNVQIKDIETAAKKWALSNLDKLDKYHVNDIYVSVEYLQDIDLLDRDTLLNPKTKEEMTGCVLIKYDFNSKQYDYTYDEIDCTSGSMFEGEENEENRAYIVYADLATVDESHAKEPFFKLLLNGDDLKADGETSPGLYNLDSEYVFRGGTDENSPIRNYVEYAGHTWRILSISKDDYTMKLIYAGVADHQAWSSGELNYERIEQQSPNLNLDNYLLEQTWYNGPVSINGDTLSLNDVKSSLTTDTIHRQRGLLSIYDYALAGTDCSDNVLSADCKNNNYLFDMFNGKNVWTMNNDGSKIWYISSTGGANVDDPTNDNNYLYPVIKVPVSVYQISGDIQTGNSDTPYKIMSSYEITDDQDDESDV